MVENRIKLNLKIVRHKQIVEYDNFHIDINIMKTLFSFKVVHILVVMYKVI